MPIRYPEAFEEDGMESARRVPCPRGSMRIRGLAANCYRLSYSLREPEKQRREAAGRGN